MNLTCIDCFSDDPIIWDCGQMGSEYCLHFICKKCCWQFHTKSWKILSKTEYKLLKVLEKIK